MKILIVEDTRVMALVLARNLEWLGYNDVVIAGSAEEALNYLKKQKFGLFIIDWMLPGLSGLELVKQIRALEKYGNTPILMATGNSAYENVRDAIEAGANDYLVKPITYEALEKKLDHLLGFKIRPAQPDDAEILVKLILELADYEKLSHEAAPDPEALRRHLASDAHPRCEALIAEQKATGEPIGFALFFANYSTFLTRWGLYLEDLYVRPAFRGRGVGFALLKRVAEIGVERGCRRMEWSVLDWNEPALSFYHQLGARPMDEWTTMRLSGEALQKLGTKED